jgi:threonine/homoserine/homoserine lactone efflux protein
MRKYRSWIPALVFWTLFLISIALGGHYLWLDTVWNLTWLLFVIIVGIWSVIEIICNRHAARGYVGYRRAPRWVARLFGDDSN